MRQAVLPDNFRCPQQDELFAFLDDVYDHGPQIAMVTAPPGTGKSHSFRQYEAIVEKRYRQRQEQRRTIALPEVKARFRSQGCLETAGDRAWLQSEWERWSGVHLEMNGMRRERISERELRELLRRRLRELEREVEQDVADDPAGERPCPRVVIITPSQTTTDGQLMRLIAYTVEHLPSTWRHSAPPHQMFIDFMNRSGGNWLFVIDEAQRLEVRPLNLTREIYDDAGATVVIAGTPELEAKLARRGAESLRSRVAVHYRMDGLSAEHVCRLLAGWDARVARRVYAYTGGVFRRIENVVRLAEQIRAVNNAPRVTMEILEEATRYIPDLLPADLRRAAAAGVAQKETRPSVPAVPESAGATTRATA
jgi:hypothetical protein